MLSHLYDDRRILSRAPFMGQGANQAIQDAYALATEIVKLNSRFTASGREDQPTDEAVKQAVKDIADTYCRKRNGPTALLNVKSAVVGAIETLEGPVGRAVRDLILGSPLSTYSYVDSAKPKV